MARRRFGVIPSSWSDHGFKFDVWDHSRARSIALCHSDTDAQWICELLNTDEHMEG